MTETISNNEKSLNILNKLILNGIYDGNIHPNRIEFVRKKFPSMLSKGNYRIIGILNDENKFELAFDFRPPLNIAVKVAIGIGIVFSIVSFAYGNWFLPIPFFIVPFLVVYIDFKLREKKEINILTSNFLELYETEYETE